MWIKFNNNQSILEDGRNQRNKLSSEHCQFILDFFNKPENFDKTILELHSELISNFNLEEGYISFRTLYDYIHRASLS